MASLFILLGGINMFLAVAFGAFGAHGLSHILTTELMRVYQTGVQYHFYHAIGLLLTGILALHWSPSQLLRYAGGFFFAGIILFSGSLYVLSLTGMRQLGIMTPFGGVAFLLGWLLVTLAAYRHRPT